MVRLIKSPKATKLLQRLKSEMRHLVTLVGLPTKSRAAMIGPDQVIKKVIVEIRIMLKWVSPMYALEKSRLTSRFEGPRAK
jgi:hypothetical protein